MKKRYYLYLVIIILFILIFNNSSSVYASGADVLSEGIKISFNGNILDVFDSAPYMNESKTMMLPLRKIGETLGFNVTWLESNEIRLQKDNEYIFLQIDSNTYYSEDYMSPTKCLFEIKGNRSYAPSSFFEEMLNVSVDYHKNQDFVVVKKNEKENRSLSIDRDSIDDGDKELWQNTIESYLKDDLWTELYAYDASNILMIPMHVAFAYNQENWKNEFSDHFDRFVKAYTYSKNDIIKGSRYRYLYLASQFVILCEESDSEHLIPNGLVNIINKEICNMWEKEPAWQWARDPFGGGIKERIQWKLDNIEVDRSYYRVISDEDFFVLAIGADLYNYENSIEDNSYMNESDYKKQMIQYAYDIFFKESSITDEGNWVFQPGVYSEHPDYAYAGNKEKSDNIQPIPIEEIAWDTSHSHKFPLWINSFIYAYESIGDINKMDYFIDIRNKLEKQFYENVLVKPNEEFDGYRTTNFMDGRNGIFRWNYPTQGQGNGYGPYELSGTFTMGWWSLLKTERVSEAYYEMAQRFPLDENVIDIYVGPNTNRERHNIVKLPDSYYNGMNELICRLASKLK